MENKQIIDARGLSCPQPVIMTKSALTTGHKSYEVIVDNSTSKENVSRYASHAGYEVSVLEQDGDYHLTLTLNQI